MTSLMSELVLPSTLALGAILGRYNVHSFVLILGAGLLSWIVIAIIEDVPLVTVLVMTLCLAVVAQVGYAAALVGRAVLLGQRKRRQSAKDTD